MLRSPFSTTAIVVVAIVSTAAFVCAQPPDTLWTCTYGGISLDRGTGVLQCDDGGFIMAGYTESFGAGGADQYVVRTDEVGDTLWTHTYGEPITDNFCDDICLTADGGYILAGTKGIYPAWDATLRKLDADGNSQWSYTYNGGSDEYGNGVCQASDGGYVMVGTTMSGGYQVLLLKVDVDGVYQWHRIIQKPGVDNGYCVQQTRDGGYIIAGQTNSYLNLWLIKTDALGYIQWERDFSGGGGADGRCVRQTDDDGYIVTGYGYFSGAYDLWLIRTDSAGNLLWNRTYGRGGAEYGRRILITDDGGYVIAGYTSSPGPSYDVLLIRTDDEGECLWYCTLGGDGADAGLGLDRTDVGGYVVGGLTKSFGTGGQDFYLALFEPETSFVWGETDLSVGEWNIDSDQLPAVRESLLSARDSVLWIHPNPFNPATVLSYELQIAGRVNLTVYDVSGRRVTELVNGWREAGIHEVTFDGSDLASGIYIYRIKAGEFTTSGKMVLMK